jgi:hypothetical protein
MQLSPGAPIMTTPMPTPILASRNETWGFFGTMRCLDQDPVAAWAIALPLIATATGCQPEGVRGFLDSRLGRHFADEVANQMARGLGLEPAILAAIDVHQNWRIDRATERRDGIPAGLSFLTGWVAHFEILDAADL